MTEVTADVIVIGGGLHGLSAAFNLAKRGAQVRLLESAWVGRHSSGASAAGVRTLNRDRRELPLALEAAAMWHNMRDIVGDDCGFHAYGQLCVAQTPEALDKLQTRVKMLEADGYHHEEILSPEEVIARAPGMSRNVLGGSFVATDGAADPHRALKAYRAAAERHGAVIVEKCPVEAIVKKGSSWQVHTPSGIVTAPAIVNAAGAWGARIAAMAGEHIPLGTKCSMMVVTERLAPHKFPVISSVGRPLSFKQTDQGTLLIGGGSQGRANLDRQTASVDFSSLARTIRVATELFEWTHDIRIVRTWAGLEAKTEDHLPVICKSDQLEGFTHVFGFSGHGFQPVPVVGEVVADLVIEGHTSHPITPFVSSRLNIRSAAA